MTLRLAPFTEVGVFDEDHMGAVGWTIEPRGSDESTTNARALFLVTLKGCGGLLMTLRRGQQPSTLNQRLIVEIFN